MAYQAPPQLPEDLASLCRVLQEELNKIQREFLASKDSVRLKVLHKPPERVYPGDLIIADGSDYDPSGLGAGEGIYRRLEDNSGWNFVG